MQNDGMGACNTGSGKKILCCLGGISCDVDHATIAQMNLDPATTPWVLCQRWEESEVGLGAHPDGYSLHLTTERRKEFIGNYWATMPTLTPSTYSRLAGEAYWCVVDMETFVQLRATGSIRRYTNDAPARGVKSQTTSNTSAERQTRGGPK